MSQILDFVFSLSGLLTFLAAAAVCLWRRPGSSAARRFLFAVVTAYVIASVYAVPHAIGRLLVLPYHEFTAADVPAPPAAIVLLGAGNATIRGWQGEHFSIQEPTGASRVLEAARVYRLMGDPLVISSGGLVNPRPLDEPSGVTMRNALIAFGLPASSIVVDDQSRSTRDEAVIVGGMLRARNIRHVVLVTSDVHMRRSIASFRPQGIAPIPAIAPDPDPPMSLFEWIVPNARGLDRSQNLVHELAGLPYYAVRGWLSMQ